MANCNFKLLILNCAYEVEHVLPVIGFYDGNCLTNRFSHFSGDIWEKATKILPPLNEMCSNLRDSCVPLIQHSLFLFLACCMGVHLPFVHLRLDLCVWTTKTDGLWLRVSVVFRCVISVVCFKVWSQPIYFPGQEEEKLKIQRLQRRTITDEKGPNFIALPISQRRHQGDPF